MMAETSEGQPRALKGNLGGQPSILKGDFGGSVSDADSGFDDPGVITIPVVRTVVHKDPKGRKTSSTSTDYISVSKLNEGKERLNKMLAGTNQPNVLFSKGNGRTFPVSNGFNIGVGDIKPPSGSIKDLITLCNPEEFDVSFFTKERRKESESERRQRFLSTPRDKRAIGRPTLRDTHVTNTILMKEETTKRVPRRRIRSKSADSRVKGSQNLFSPTYSKILSPECMRNRKMWADIVRKDCILEEEYYKVPYEACNREIILGRSCSSETLLSNFRRMKKRMSDEGPINDIEVIKDNLRLLKRDKNKCAEMEMTVPDGNSILSSLIRDLCGNNTNRSLQSKKKLYAPLNKQEGVTSTESIKKLIHDINFVGSESEKTSEAEEFANHSPHNSETVETNYHDFINVEDDSNSDSISDHNNGSPDNSTIQNEIDPHSSDSNTHETFIPKKTHYNLNADNTSYKNDPYSNIFISKEVTNNLASAPADSSYTGIIMPDGKGNIDRPTTYNNNESCRKIVHNETEWETPFRVNDTTQPHSSRLKKKRLNNLKKKVSFSNENEELVFESGISDSDASVFEDFNEVMNNSNHSQKDFSDYNEYESHDRGKDSLIESHERTPFIFEETELNDRYSCNQLNKDSQSLFSLESNSPKYLKQKVGHESNSLQNNNQFKLNNTENHIRYNKNELSPSNGNIYNSVLFTTPIYKSIPNKNKIENEIMKQKTKLIPNYSKGNRVHIYMTKGPSFTDHEINFTTRKLSTGPNITITKFKVPFDTIRDQYNFETNQLIYDSNQCPQNLKNTSELHSNFTSYPSLNGSISPSPSEGSSTSSSGCFSTSCSPPISPWRNNRGLFPTEL